MTPGETKEKMLLIITNSVWVNGNSIRLQAVHKVEETPI